MKSKEKIHNNEIQMTKNKASEVVKTGQDKNVKALEENSELKAKIDKIKKKFKNRLNNISESYDKKVIFFVDKR